MRRRPRITFDGSNIFIFFLFRRGNPNAEEEAEDQRRLTAMREELQMLREEEEALDGMLLQAQDQLRKLSEDKNSKE